MLEPAGGGGADHGPLPVVQDPAAAGVDGHDRDRAEVAPVAPPVALGPVGLPVRGRRELVQQRADVPVGLADRGVDLVVGQRGRGQVAQVLVDPVGRQPAGDPLLPPRGLLHPAPPDGRGVPVVVHVVVVEDHRRRHGRVQPAHQRVAPGLRVEHGVLVEVGHLQTGRLGHVAAAADHVLGDRRGVVGVDLVAEQQQPVRPLVVGGVGQPARVRIQGVGAVAAVAHHRQRRGVAAGAEGEPDRPPGRRGPDPRRRHPGVGRRPHQLAVQPDLVVGGRARLQALHRHQRVVPLADLEGRL